jgi:hypothetical protein
MPTTSPFYAADTYERDLPLFKQLGLTPFEGNVDQKRFKVGTVFIHGGKVDVFVTCFPAMFWRFEIADSSGKKSVMRTGSGTLSEYWPIVEKIVSGMISVWNVNEFSEVE